MTTSPSFPTTTQRSIDWPQPLDAAAFHGLAGRIVDTIAPYTEADRAALLIQFLVAFGNSIGPGPHFTVESTRHGLNLFAVLVGETAAGRKGTAFGHVDHIFGAAESELLQPSGC